MICESFGCLPSEAEREIERLPDGYLDTVMQLRAYASVKSAIDQAYESPEPGKALQRITDRSVLAETVFEIEAELRREAANEARRRRENGE